MAIDRIDSIGEQHCQIERMECSMLINTLNRTDFHLYNWHVFFLWNIHTIKSATNNSNYNDILFPLLFILLQHINTSN